MRDRNAEKVLEDEPTIDRRTSLLKEAGDSRRAGQRFGVFALRTLPKKIRDVKAYTNSGVCTETLERTIRRSKSTIKSIQINPLDAEALRLGKDAAAHASMKSGGWTHGKLPRLIKDKEIAIRSSNKTGCD